MKIYSLQEENDKLNAARGIEHPGINHGMFDVKKTAVSSRRQIRTSPVSQGRTVMSAPKGRTVMPAPQQRRTSAPVSPSSPQHSSGQKPGRRSGMLIGWFLLILFLFLINYITDII